VDEAEVVRLIAALPGAVVVTADADGGAPEVARGDSFAFYDPDDDGDAARRFPFATVVTKDYPGFDTESRLDRPGVFRLNLPAGRARFTELFGFSPADLDDHRGDFAFDVLDHLMPHPVYGRQGWVSVVVPGPATERQVRELIVHAHERARRRYGRRGAHGQDLPDDDQ
jgi:Family of unknown function (DUF6194)